MIFLYEHNWVQFSKLYLVHSPASMQEEKIPFPYHLDMTQPLIQVMSLLPSVMITQDQVLLPLLVSWMGMLPQVK